MWMQRTKVMAGIALCIATIVACEGTIPGWEPLPGPAPRTDAPMENPSDQFIMVSTMASSDAVDDYAESLGFEHGILIGAAVFDNDHDGHLDGIDGISRFLRTQVPENFAGYITLDWETPLMNRLRSYDSNPADFNAALDDALTLLNFVKQRRPRAKVGYYGFPYREYWNQDEKWLKDMQVLQPLYDASDVLMPSAYDLYDQITKDDERNKAMVRIWLRYAGDKPMLIYTHSRYHQSNKDVGLRTIPEAEFRSHIRAIMTASYQGRQPDGIIVWGGDRYWLANSYRKKKDSNDWVHEGALWDNRRVVFADERIGNESDQEMLDRLHKRNYRLVRDELAEIAATRQP